MTAATAPSSAWTPQEELLRRKESSSFWFRLLRDDIIDGLEKLERDADPALYPGTPAIFERKFWQREGGGGGEMSTMRGRMFEKAGVNISTVWGEFAEPFRKEIPGADKDPRFWASGISLVIHPKNPHVPTVHMNTRMIVVGGMDKPQGQATAFCKSWLGGGMDLTPMLPDEESAEKFHQELKRVCGAHGDGIYDKYKKWCDEYFFLKHRNEARGIGGIFYDYVDSGDWEADFSFTQDVGKAFVPIYSEIVRHRFNQPWTEAEKEQQRIKRGRYVEFNLLHDRGTRFGIMTGGNTEAILMSLPPEASWP